MNRILKLVVVVVSLFLFSFTSPNGDSIRIVKNGNGTYMYLSQDINFVLNETSIDNSCKRQLYLVLHYLKKNPDLKIEIGVHNDARTSDDLSQVRADILKDFFEKYGISSTHVTAKGYHVSSLIHNCLDKTIKCSEQEQSANRRVEIKILNPSLLKEFIVVNTDGKLTKN